jgi:hypothetical protein
VSFHLTSELEGIEHPLVHLGHVRLNRHGSRLVDGLRLDATPHISVNDRMISASTIPRGMESEEVYLVPGQLRGCIANDAGSLRHVRLANQLLMLRVRDPLIASELSSLVQPEVVLACGRRRRLLPSEMMSRRAGRGMRAASARNPSTSIRHSLDGDHDVEASIREACLTRISVA